jgi:hypothetical protein
MKQTSKLAYLFLIAVVLLVGGRECVYYENEAELNPVLSQDQYDFVDQQDGQPFNQPFRYDSLLNTRVRPQPPPPPSIFSPSLVLNQDRYESPFIYLTTTGGMLPQPTPTQPSFLANQHHNIFAENDNSKSISKPGHQPQTFHSIPHNAIAKTDAASNRTFLRLNNAAENRVKAFKNGNSLEKIVAIQRKLNQTSSFISTANLNESRKALSNETKYGQIDSIIKEINQTYTIDLNRKYNSEHKINCLNCSQITYAEECKDFADYDFNELINIFCCQCNSEM